MGTEDNFVKDFGRLIEIVSKRPIICFRQSLGSAAWLKEEAERKILSLDRFYDLKTYTQTICILEFTNETESICCLGWIDKKSNLLTYKAKIFIKNFGRISFDNFEQIAKKLENQKARENFFDCIKDGFVLSSNLSVKILEILKENDMETLQCVFGEIHSRPISDVQLAREDAVNFALKVFGVPINKKYLYEVDKLYEDNVILKDANVIDGYIKTRHLNIGKTTFAKENRDYLSLYSANKQPLEQMLGVDLIYINEVCGNIVMVQYKMLEPQGAADDWIFRHDKQTESEISRMVLPEIDKAKTDYRLNANPFYFRFVKRKPNLVTDGIQTFNIALDHYNNLLKSTAHMGKNGGLRISYKALNGTYLRETEFIDLIHSGYIGTYSVETEYLKILIEAVARGNKEIVLAWQHSYKK